MKVTKAVFPVAGLGTRFLPATKAMPKEMLPVVDNPLIQYAVEVALNAGIEDIIFVTGKGKQAIEDHFDHSCELEQTLVARGKEALLKVITQLIPESGTLVYTRQNQPLGLGRINPWAWGMPSGAPATWWVGSLLRFCWPTT
ncbi:MAG: sugar phosphate nucleotidyltransferase [Desulfobacteraceae bacterium]